MVISPQKSQRQPNPRSGTPWPSALGTAIGRALARLTTSDIARNCYGQDSDPSIRCRLWLTSGLVPMALASSAVESDHHIACRHTGRRPPPFAPSAPTCPVSTTWLQELLVPSVALFFGHVDRCRGTRCLGFVSAIFLWQSVRLASRGWPGGTRRLPLPRRL
jgi:hypothetical protein